jgi:hypothetical protein
MWHAVGHTVGEAVGDRGEKWAISDISLSYFSSKLCGSYRCDVASPKLSALDCNKRLKTLHITSP